MRSNRKDDLPRISFALIILCASLAIPIDAAGQTALPTEASASVPAPVDSVTSAGDAFLTGAAAGLVSGAVIGAILATDEDDLAGSYDLAAGLFAGALIGALVGGLTALVIHQRR